MKTNALLPVVVSSLVVDDSSSLLAVTQSALASNLMAAVGHRNVTTMQALVQELADESVNEPGWKFDQDIQDALNSIRNMFVKSIQVSLKDEHKVDQEDMNCFTKNCFGKCVDDYEADYEHCASQTQKCDGLGAQHTKCRKEVYGLYKAMGKACGALHCYEVPDVPCKPEECTSPELGNCHKRTEGTYGGGECEAIEGRFKAELKDSAGLFKEVTGGWLKQELNKFVSAQAEWKSLHQKCQDAYQAFLTADMSCDSTQKEFESCLCQKNACEDQACNTDYDQCMTGCWDIYETKIKEKECLEKDRKIDWSATKKIECYIDVLLHNYTKNELLTKCGSADCINKAREEDYKHCATICPQIDHDGCWPEVAHLAVNGHQKRAGEDQYHLGDGEYKCDENGPAVFTKHRGHHASEHKDDDSQGALVKLDRNLETRCTEHLDLDYPMPRCVGCKPPPPPPCDAAFHKEWYEQFDDTSKIGCISDCCSDFSEDVSKTCFTPQEMQSSTDGELLEKITLYEHSHAWAFNRCPCTECSKQVTPDYGARPAGRQCGDGPHTILPAGTCKNILEYKNLCIEASGDNFASINLEDNLCIDKMTFTHKEGSLSCRHPASGDSNWGCDAKSLGLVLTDSNNVVTAPAFYTVEGMTPHFSTHAPWYKIDGVSKTSEQMEWIFKQPYRFGKADYKLWYGEDLTGGTEGDNRGRACFDLALQHSKSCHALAPLQFHKVCVSAKGDKPHTITLPEGTHVTEIDIHWTKGKVTCRTEGGESNFGCDGNSLGLVWTKHGDKKVVMPKQGEVKGVTVGAATHAHWYTMDQVSRDSRTLPMKLEKPRTMVGSFDLWYNEDLTGGTEGDNDGEACYEVTVHRG